MSEHTPGPWTMHKHSLGIIGEAHINGPHNCAIAYVGFGTQTPDHYVTGEEAEANALLIAATPEMSHALQLFIAFCEGQISRNEDYYWTDEYRNIYKISRAAIAKATGGV